MMNSKYHVKINTNDYILQERIVLIEKNAKSLSSCTTNSNTTDVSINNNRINKPVKKQVNSLGIQNKNKLMNIKMDENNDYFESLFIENINTNQINNNVSNVNSGNNVKKNSLNLDVDISFGSLGNEDKNVPNPNQNHNVKVSKDKGIIKEVKEGKEVVAVNLKDAREVSKDIHATKESREDKKDSKELKEAIASVHKSQAVNKIYLRCSLRIISTRNWVICLIISVTYGSLVFLLL